MQKKLDIYNILKFTSCMNPDFVNESDHFF